MLNTIAGFLLLFLQGILIYLVAFFLLGCYAKYIIYQPFFEKTNHQLTAKK